MASPQGKPIPIWLFKESDQLRVAVDSGSPKPPWFAGFASNTSMNVVSDGAIDQVMIPLVEGAYVLAGAGFSERVQNGTFDLYAPAAFGSALFTIGAEKKGMVGSPGNAANVITVGAYDFRSSWVNQAGTEVFHNLDIGALSTYSSPGGVRSDGVVKPDIVAPASFTISPLSRISAQAGESCQGRMGSGDDRGSITRDGYHLAWAGTSAAAPFTAGVIALMLQKNPTLDSEQIRKILTSTAIRNDAFVGVVPNPEWGYGKLNPAAALAATPSPGSRP
jgi:subtilisin family serine protease